MLDIMLAIFDCDSLQVLEVSVTDKNYKIATSGVFRQR